MTPVKKAVCVTVQAVWVAAAAAAVYAIGGWGGLKASGLWMLQIWTVNFWPPWGPFVTPIPQFAVLVFLALPSIIAYERAAKPLPGPGEGNYD